MTDKDSPPNTQATQVAQDQRNKQHKQKMARRPK